MKTQPTNIYDAFFKSLLSESEMADTFLREHLPREVVELLAPQPSGCVCQQATMLPAYSQARLLMPKRDTNVQI